MSIEADMKSNNYEAIKGRINWYEINAKCIEKHSVDMG